MVVHRVAGSCVVLLLLASTVVAQQVTITTPNNNVQHSFFENFGVGFGFNLRTNATPEQIAQAQSGLRVRPSMIVGLLPNGAINPTGDIQFRQAGAGSALPPAGGFDPSNVAQTGFAIGGRAGTAFFNLQAGQGSSITNTMEAPSVTLMNGYPGSISDQIQTPFITSVTPIVGGWSPGYSVGPTVPAPVVAPSGSSLLERFQRLQAGEGATGRGAPRAAAPAAEPARAIGLRGQMNAAAQSTAGQGAESIAKIQQQRALIEQSGDDAAAKLFARAQQAQEAGKPGLAKIYYRMAAKEATGPLKQEAQQRLRDLAASAAKGTTPQ